MTLNKGMFTSASEEWETPQDLFNKLNAQQKRTTNAINTLQKSKTVWRRIGTVKLCGVIHHMAAA